MKTMKQLFTLACIVIAISISSCSKEGPQGPAGINGTDGIDGVDGTNGVDGEALGAPGPQGEQGIQGETGPAGPAGEDGENGEDGEDGNANILTSFHNLTNVNGTSYTLSTILLTAEHVENGVILAYVRISNLWHQIPNQRIITNNLTTIDISTYFSPIGSSYSINLSFSNNGTPVSLSAGDLDQMRLVALPSSTSSSGKSTNQSELEKLVESGVDLNNYYDVMDYLNLEY